MRPTGTSDADFVAHLISIGGSYEDCSCKDCAFECSMKRARKEQEEANYRRAMFLGAGAPSVGGFGGQGWGQRGGYG